MCFATIRSHEFSCMKFDAPNSDLLRLALDLAGGDGADRAELVTRS